MLTPASHSGRVRWIDTLTSLNEPVLRELPERLQTLNLTRNRLTGTPDLTALPGTLNLLAIDDNLFVGRPNFSRLPEDLAVLELDKNGFTGPGGVWTKNDTWCTRKRCRVSMCGTFT
eukprot:Hpha_TRINITY_DN22416_c0_g1::TRINITY_DN22416_c0_g1_i1::g.94950::m.94950